MPAATRPAFTLIELLVRRGRRKGFTLIELLVVVTSVVVLLTVVSATASSQQQRVGATAFELVKQDRVPTAGGEAWTVRTRAVRWEAGKTAVIVCDMWDHHWCRSAEAHTGELAPRINLLVEEARRRGALVIHAPSEVMAHYDGTPARFRAQQAPRAANLPADIDRWCNSIPGEEKGRYPIDQSDGGCDDEPRCKNYRAWTGQIETIRIDQERDAVSDSGTEVWNLLEQRGIGHVMLVGVHTNMCVLGRPFGLRQLARNGRDVVLVRDLTDTMYNPGARPFVDHFRGTGLIVEHIERYVCPTVTSEQVLGGQPFRFARDPGGAGDSR